MVASTALAVFTTAACETDRPTDIEPAKQWSVSFQWDGADPAVDLSTPAIRAIRGAVESDAIEVGIGKPYTYPGYIEAAGLNRTIGGEAWTDDPADPVGTLRLKIVVREVTPTSVDTVVCRDETGVTRSAGGRYPLPPTTQAYGLWATRVSVERADSPNQTSAAIPSYAAVTLREPTSPEMTGPPGRSPRPDEDIFGGWKISEYEGDYSIATRSLCMPWIEQLWGGANPPAPARTETEPPAIEPFYPGW
ncbi:hypothetical protein A6I85_19065 [Prescottella equi]|nr:hypothetical protein A6I85_19065 [Prescottella equi]